MHNSSHPRSSKHSADPFSFRDPLSSSPIAGRKGRITGYPKVSSKRSLSRTDFCGMRGLRRKTEPNQEENLGVS